MSGPKGASYVVVSAAELRRRAVQAANQRLTAAIVTMHELQQLAGADAAWAGREPARPVVLEPEEIDAQAAAVVDYSQRLEDAVRKRQIMAASEQVKASLADFEVALAVEARPVASRETPTDHHVALRAELAELANRLPELPEPDRSEFLTRIHAASTAVTGPDAARAAQVVGALRTAVGAALHSAADRAVLERRRASLELTYADVADAAPAAWTALAAANDDLGLARARRLLDAARAAVVQASDQQFVLAQAAEALQALGYRVEVSQGEGAGEIVARKDAWQRHGLRLLFPETQGAFSSVPEAYGATDARDDVAFEQASCRDVAAVLDELGRRGVRTQLRTHLQPGTQPMRRATPASARRTKAAPVAKERTL